MAYNKTTWKRGDVVTSAGLNNMEDGIEQLDNAVGGLSDGASDGDALLYNGGEQLWKPMSPPWAKLVETESINAFSPTMAIRGGVMEPSGNVMSISRDYFYSYIPVDAPGSFVFPQVASFAITGAVALFDADKNYIGRLEGVVSSYTADQSLVTISISNAHVTSGVAFFSFSEMSDRLSTLMVIKGTQYPDSYIAPGTVKTIEGLQIYRRQIIDDNMASNPLLGKILAANGDSICAGALYRGGYAKIIAEQNNMTLENTGVDGATIATGTGVDHIISTSIVNMREDADYVLLEGGVNDSSHEVTLGSLTSGYTDTLDTDTFAGAFEYMLKAALTRFPTAKIGYIFVHKAQLGDFDSRDGANSYYGIAKQACEKWGIPYCDLNILCPPFAFVSSLQEYSDGVHPTEAAYRIFYVPKITAWMKTL